MSRQQYQNLNEKHRIHTEYYGRHIRTVNDQLSYYTLIGLSSNVTKKKLKGRLNNIRNHLKPPSGATIKTHKFDIIQYTQLNAIKRILENDKSRALYDSWHCLANYEENDDIMV